MEDVHDLYGTHDEINTFVAFHAVHFEQLDPGNTVIRCNDTDVIRCNDTDIIIIMLLNIQILSQSHVWLDMGYTSSGVYAFTGCNYTPVFFRKGKKRPMK